jgi:adenylate cyclase
MLLRSATIGLVAFLSVWCIRLAGGLDAASLWFYDAYVRHAVSDRQEPSRITVITVSEADIQALDTWPISDGRLAELIDKIASLSPRVIGLDIYRDIDEPPGSERLAQTLTDHENVVGIFKFPAGEGPSPGSHAVLSSSGRVGFSDVVTDHDGLVRRAILFMGEPGEQPGFAFALQVAIRYLVHDGVLLAPDPRRRDWLRIGASTLAPLELDNGPYRDVDVGGYQTLFDFKVPIERFDYVALSDALAGLLGPELVRDRVVLLGTTAASVPDLFYTPLDANVGELGATAGVALHAQLIDQLLRAAVGEARTLTGIGPHWIPVWIVLWCLVAASSCAGQPSLWRPIVLVFVGLALLPILTFALFSRGWWFPPVEAALGWVLAIVLATIYSARSEANERRKLMRLFARQLSPELAQTIWAQRELLLEGGRPRPVALTSTVLFSDVQGFTGIAERLSAPELLEWLTEYLDEMASAVVQGGGIVVQFVGDAVMAAYGAPIARSSDDEVRADACRAVESALDMEKRLARLNERLTERGLPMIGVRIGINTGRMVGGLVGSREHQEYNIHGDAVNTAARLERLDSEEFRPDHLVHPCRILAGEATRDLVTGRFDCVVVGELRLKGKARPVTVYRVVGETAKTQPARGDDASTGSHARVPNGTAPGDRVV